MDKALLKKLKALYVEDDDSIRHELSSLLSSFFGKIYVAKDGKEGLSTYLKNQDEIDVIISDINMPYLTGIQMVDEIRKINKDVWVVFTTAYSDNQYLADAIKLKVYDYIIKPIDIRKLLSTLSELSKIIYQNELITKQNIELEKYKDVIDLNNIVIKTDSQFKITYVNELFCETTGFLKEELLNKEFKSLKHKESPNELFDEMYDKVLDLKEWKGRIKCLCKDGNYYISDTIVISTTNDSNEFSGALCVQKDITDEINKKREIQLALMKDKGDIFIKSKADWAEQAIIINNLNSDLNEIKAKLKKTKTEKDKYFFKVEKLSKDNKKINAELQSFIQNEELSQDRSALTLKLNRENSNLRLDIKRLNAKIEELKFEHEKECKQIQVNADVEIEDLKQELTQLKSKLDEIDTAEVMSQKIEYWKEKAKSEAKKAEQLEKKILQHGDKNILTKLFGTK